MSKWVEQNYEIEVTASIELVSQNKWEGGRVTNLLHSIVLNSSNDRNFSDQSVFFNTHEKKNNEIVAMMRLSQI